MAANQTRRPARSDIEADIEALRALRQLRDYAPINPIYSVATLTELSVALEQAEEREKNISDMLAAARDEAIAAAWAFHNAVLGAKIQVMAQYGNDSNAIESLGLKKKSERKRPQRGKLRDVNVISTKSE